ncbi:MAG: Asp-tRNA(Asn)/Glu-tRNA(Gln) amidotransferase subunit GatB [Patescibacteria group bacterium]|nr:Asp-tRNA(Asn)/Glu-tRNA(Gln) amidotransferase subunit GatB [Patescibacteria group bacterium]
MDDKKYTPVIGLEIHVELKTKSKMFCGCLADYFGHKPNTHCCPVCLGLPGALPVPNKTAIDWCIMIGLALNCKIPNFSKFDRKNYFYPDLPKGYQISQYDKPFCIDGKLEINVDSYKKLIGITRVHMEEDTGKLIHSMVDGKDVSLIDFNRSSVPLVEIVTEPDFKNSKEVKIFLQKLQQVVRYLGVSNADMEKGDMRLEPNISLKITGEKSLPKYKVEVKNINSFKFVEKAIDFEIKRQKEILESGETPAQETRGFDEKKGKTVSQRSKEEAHDYRYFPEPDIPPIKFTDLEIDSLKKAMPELPDEKFKRLQKEHSLSEYDSEILTREKSTADYFEEAVKIGKDHNVLPKQIANTIINKKINVNNVLPAELIKMIISTTQVAAIDEGELEKIVKMVLDENPKAVEDYKNGKTQAIGFLIGMISRKLNNIKLDSQKVKKILERHLN